MSTATELTVVDAKLEATIEQAHLEPATAQGLLETFRPLFAKAREISATAANLSVTDATQVTEIKQARSLRLALRAVRIEAEKARKTLKEDSLRRSKAIDGVYNVLEYAVVPVEKQLLDMEEFAQRAEASRKAKIKADREQLLAPYGIDTTFFQLAEMSEQAFAQLLDNTRTAHEAKQLAAKRAEEERIAREKAEAAERERVRQENERLKREAEEREAVANAEREKLQREKAEIEARARAEREAAEATAREERRKSEEAARIERERVAKEKAELERKATEERKARERLEAEAKVRREAEEKRQREEAEAAAQAAAAPDREKLVALAALIRTVEVPEMSTKAGKQAGVTAAQLIEQLAREIDGIAAGLNARGVARRVAA
jgi:hypothetical protein